MHIVTLLEFPVEAKTEQVVGCHRLELPFCLELSKAKIYSLILKDIFLKFCAGIEATLSVFSLCFLGGASQSTATHLRETEDRAFSLLSSVY